MKRLLLFSLTILLTLLAYSCAHPKLRFGKNGEAKFVAKPVILEKMKSGNIDFHAQLSPKNELPPLNIPNASGDVDFKISKDSTMIYYKITVKNLKNITEATINYGTNEYNGPIILTMYPARHTEADSLLGKTFSGTLRISTLQKIHLEDGSLDGKKIIDLIHTIRHDSAYVQIGTKYHKKGAIRGQIKSD